MCDEEVKVIDLDKELAYELKKNNMSIFSKKQPQPFMIDTDYTCGIEGLLNKYKSKYFIPTYLFLFDT